MVVILRSALREIVRHCVATAPIEAVGMLAGRDNVVEYCEALRNVVPPPHNQRAFLADPYEQFVAERSIAARGLKLIAIYHSHPDGGASLSAEDLAFSRERPCLQVVVAVSMAEPKDISLRAFRVDDAGVKEEPISVRQ